MKKFFTLTTALILMAGVSKAVKNDVDVKSSTTTNSVENKTTAPATATSISLADVLKENQQLKLQLQKVTAEKEALESKVDYQHNMHFSTVSLYEAQLEKKDEDAKNQSGFAWIMHNVILNLTNALKSDK